MGFEMNGRTLYVDLAADLDDGEAMTIAIAYERRILQPRTTARHDASRENVLATISCCSVLPRS